MKKLIIGGCLQCMRVCEKVLPTHVRRTSCCECKIYIVRGLLSWMLCKMISGFWHLIGCATFREFSMLPRHWKKKYTTIISSHEEKHRIFSWNFCRPITTYFRKDDVDNRHEHWWWTWTKQDPTNLFSLSPFPLDFAMFHHKNTIQQSFRLQKLSKKRTIHIRSQLPLIILNGKMIYICNFYLIGEIFCFGYVLVWNIHFMHSLSFCLVHCGLFVVLLVYYRFRFLCVN